MRGISRVAAGQRRWRMPAVAVLLLQAAPAPAVNLLGGDPLPEPSNCTWGPNGEWVRFGICGAAGQPPLLHSPIVTMMAGSKEQDLPLYELSCKGTAFRPPLSESAENASRLVTCFSGHGVLESWSAARAWSGGRIQAGDLGQVFNELAGELGPVDKVWRSLFMLAYDQEGVPVLRHPDQYLPESFYALHLVKNSDHVTGRYHTIIMDDAQVNCGTLRALGIDGGLIAEVPLTCTSGALWASLDRMLPELHPWGVFQVRLFPLVAGDAQASEALNLVEVDIPYWSAWGLVRLAALLLALLCLLGAVLFWRRVARRRVRRAKEEPHARKVVSIDGDFDLQVAPARGAKASVSKMKVDRAIPVFAALDQGPEAFDQLAAQLMDVRETLGGVRRSLEEELPHFRRQLELLEVRVNGMDKQLGLRIERLEQRLERDQGTAALMLQKGVIFPAPPIHFDQPSESENLRRTIRQALTSPGFLEAVEPLARILDRDRGEDLEAIAQQVCQASRRLEALARQHVNAGYLLEWVDLRDRLADAVERGLPLIQAVAVLARLKDEELAYEAVMGIRGFALHLMPSPSDAFLLWQQTMQGLATDRVQARTAGLAWIKQCVVVEVLAPLVSLFQFLFRALSQELPLPELKSVLDDCRLNQAETRIGNLYAVLGYRWLPVKLYQVHFRRLSGYSADIRAHGAAALHGQPLPMEARSGIVFRERKPLLESGPAEAKPVPTAELWIFSAVVGNEGGGTTV